MDGASAKIAQQDQNKIHTIHKNKAAKKSSTNGMKATRNTNA